MRTLAASARAFAFAQSIPAAVRHRVLRAWLHATTTLRARAKAGRAMLRTVVLSERVLSLSVLFAIEMRRDFCLVCVLH